MSDPVAPAPRVVVAMLTFRRPDDLDAALPALLAQVDAAPFPARILVVDNDPAGGAMDRAGQFDAGSVTFVHEPRSGIAAARNTAIDSAADTDLLVFVDDDERPGPGWLAHLVSTWQSTGAAAVVGPVVSTFPSEPEEWIVAGGFFRRRRLPTGTETDVAATNNLLLDLRQVRAAGVRFDTRFGLAGGSDTLFTRRLHQQGGRLVWCDEAVVTDVVPPQRLTRRWVLRRALRTGNSWSRVEVALAPSGGARLAARLRGVVTGVARVAGGVLRWSWGALTRSVTHRANGARTTMRGLGMASGALGYTYAEYRRREGDG